MLNSFLQMIEHDQSNSLIIAATNQPEALDHALYRRFDDGVQYRMPTTIQALDLIRSRLGLFASKPFKNEGLAAQAEGLSYAEICRAVDESIKDAIMHDQSKVLRTALGRALEERRQISHKLVDNKPAPSHAGSNKR